MKKIKTVTGGITAAQGYSASAVSAGIKYSRPDMALLFSEKPASIAATFTTNKIQGAHVTLCKEHVKKGVAQAIVINSGCANACVGPIGYKNAVSMASLTGKALGINPKTVFPCSTGTIGIMLPMDKIAKGIKMAASGLKKNGGPDAARAIMTTDTRDKQCAVEIIVDGKPVRIGGMAKGAGMIEPNMATMLCYITSDAAVNRTALQQCLSAAVRDSFNKISVDGDQSCNDTVLLLANGMAGNRMLSPAHKDWSVFDEAVRYVTRELALMVVKDGEGATKFVTIRLKGARTPGDARKAVRAVANSLLVKTAWFGCDPNWGRIIDAIGYSGADVIESKVDIRFDGLGAVHHGRKAPGFELKKLEEVFSRKSFIVDIDLHLGNASDIVYTCDCSEEYVKINSDYMT